MNKYSAIGLIQTWLDACGIKYRSTKNTFSIVTPAGKRVNVIQNINPQEIMSTDLDVSLAAFHRLTKETGHGTPQPLPRGKAASKRTNGDPILSRWRHIEMRTVPNASPEILRQYEDVCLREARFFYGRQKRLCQDMSYDIDMAHNDALVWANTFIGRYKLYNKGLNDNRKLLSRFLRQRFKDLAGSLIRQRRSVHPGIEYELFREGQNAEEPDDAWKEAHDEIGVTSRKPRQAKAKELLESSLAEIGHDKAMKSLREIAASHPCVDTQRAARQYLRKHQAECGECQ